MLKDIWRTKKDILITMIFLLIVAIYCVCQKHYEEANFALVLMAIDVQTYIDYKLRDRIKTLESKIEELEK